MELFMPFKADGKTCAFDAKFRGFHCTWFRSVDVFCAPCPRNRISKNKVSRIFFGKLSCVNEWKWRKNNDVFSCSLAGLSHAVCAHVCDVYANRPLLTPITHSRPLFCCCCFFFHFALQFCYFHLSSAQQRPRPSKYINRDNRALLCTQ